MTRHRVPLHEELTRPTVFQRQAVPLAGREARQVFRGYCPEPVVTLDLRKRDHDALSNGVSSTLADGASKKGIWQAPCRSGRVALQKIIRASDGHCQVVISLITISYVIY